MSLFFINRPIFAWVIAILIMLGGIISLLNLPIDQYPTIAPPSVSVNATYPGASADTINDTVVQVIEQQMKGLDGLSYMSSSAASNGSAQVTLTFVTGTDPDIAQVQVQNNLQSAMASLPEAVQRQGITIEKGSSNFFLVEAFISEDGSMDRVDIADYVNSEILDPISRVEGVGDVQVFGSSYAMRIWLDPVRLRSYNLVPADVVSAIKAQNAEVSAGQLGQSPADKDNQVINATVSVQSYLHTPEEFRDILLIANSGGAQVHLRDVATVEMGSANYSVTSLYNGQQAAGLGIALATNANVLDTRELVAKRIEELSEYFPSGLKPVVAYDTTPFIKLSIEDVAHTLIEAIVLVFVVMFIFLQNWRATIIPTLAVPVVLLGAFGVLYVIGFSINVLTMFAMVLAIGLLVDDAIVVVENVERILEENPEISVKDATIQSMNEISRIVIGIALVLSAVFVPMAFFGGSTGVIYRQFSITLISSMVLSAIVALVFTPALCVTILKRNKDHVTADEKSGFFGWFNRSFTKLSHKYERFVGKSLNLKLPYLVAYLVIVGILVAIFTRIPTSFLPNEDQGIMMTIVQLPAGAPLSETEAVLDKVNTYYEENEADNVASVFTISGFSFGGQGQNMGLAFLSLTDWDKRKGKENGVQAISERAMKYFSTQINEAQVYAIVPPPITELGNATGFDLMIQDAGGLGHDKLLAARNQLLGMAAKNEQLDKVRPNGQEDAPQLKVNINQDQAAAYGLPLSSINSVIATAWGSTYVNDFVDRGRIKMVFAQGQPDSRTNTDDLGKWYVRNQAGDMISFNAFSSTEWEYGSPRLTRYNGLPSMEIQGNAAPGFSTGEAMQQMQQMISKLPSGIGYEWTGMSLEEVESGGSAPILYAISLLIVFLCLAAMYESWAIPFAVLLVVPLGVLGAVLFTWARHFSNDVYMQVGLVTVVGLSTKNAILIIEFAKELHEDGHSLRQAVMTAARQRLRPILMTSLAFGVGVVPLFTSTGAGSGSQTAIGTSVLGGVISASLLGVFFVPMFYIWIRNIFPLDKDKDKSSDPIDPSTFDKDSSSNGTTTHNSHPKTPSLGDNSI